MADDKKTEQPAAVPVAKIVSDKAREKMVPLEYPVEYDGKVWTEIRVHRVTAGEVSDWIKRLDSDEDQMPPVVDCPMAVWNALDADDQDTVDKEAMAFTPRRLKAAAELIQGNGEATSLLSPTPSTSGDTPK